MVQRPCPDLRGGCAAMRIPTVTEGRGSVTTPPTRPQYQATSIAYRADAPTSPGLSRAPYDRRPPASRYRFSTAAYRSPARSRRAPARGTQSCVGCRGCARHAAAQLADRVRQVSVRILERGREAVDKSGTLGCNDANLRQMDPTPLAGTAIRRQIPEVGVGWLNCRLQVCARVPGTRVSTATVGRNLL